MMVAVRSHQVPSTGNEVPPNTHSPVDNCGTCGRWWHFKKSKCHLNKQQHSNEKHTQVALVAGNSLSMYRCKNKAYKDLPQQKNIYIYKGLATICHKCHPSEFLPLDGSAA